MAGLASIFGVLFHRCRQLFHAGCGLFQRSCLLFGTRREIVVAHRNFAGTAVNRIGTLTNFPDRARQFTLHVTQRMRQLAHFVVTLNIDTLHQIATGNMANAFD